MSCASIGFFSLYLIENLKNSDSSRHTHSSIIVDGDGDGDGNTLWCHGIQGSGKTNLVCVNHPRFQKETYILSSNPNSSMHTQLHHRRRSANTNNTGAGADADAEHAGRLLLPQPRGSTSADVACGAIVSAAAGSRAGPLAPGNGAGRVRHGAGQGWWCLVGVRVRAAPGRGARGAAARVPRAGRAGRVRRRAPRLAPADAGPARPAPGCACSGDEPAACKVCFSHPLPTCYNTKRRN